MALFKSNRLPLVPLLLLVVFVGHALAATYTVGDAIGWRVPDGGEAVYSNWASTHTFRVGDILVFNFTTGAHDVAVVTQAAYDSCSSNGALNLITLGPANMPLNSTGTHHFICTFGTHCAGGQKLAVNVAAAATSPSPSPRPAPPSPPTMPPSTTPGAPAMPPSTTPGAPMMPPSTTPGAPTMPPSTTPGAPTMPPSTTPGAPTEPPSGSTPTPTPSPVMAGPPTPSSTMGPSGAPGGSMGPPAPGPSSGGTGTPPPSPSSATITRRASAFVIAFVSISILHRLVI